MSTKTLLPSSSSHITDRYFFRSQSNDARLPSKHKKIENTSPSQRKRYKFPSKNPSQHPNIYQFSNNQNQKRAHSSDTNRYYFSLDQSFPTPQQTSTYLRSGTGPEQRSVTFIEGSSTTISDTPYLFSKPTRSHKKRSTTSTYVRPEGKNHHHRKIIFHFILCRYKYIST